MTEIYIFFGGLISGAIITGISHYLGSNSANKTIDTFTQPIELQKEETQLEELNGYDWDSYYKEVAEFGKDTELEIENSDPDNSKFEELN